MTFFECNFPFRPDIIWGASDTDGISDISLDANEPPQHKSNGGAVERVLYVWIYVNIMLGSIIGMPVVTSLC